MSETERCPKCGAAIRESRAIGSDVHIVGTWFACGSLESKENGKVVLFTASDKCRIAESHNAMPALLSELRTLRAAVAEKDAEIDRIAEEKADLMAANGRQIIEIRETRQQLADREARLARLRSALKRSRRADRDSDGKYDDAEIAAIEQGDASRIYQS